MNLRAEPSREDEPLRLLLIEDDLDAAGLMEEALVDHFGPGCVSRCASVGEAQQEDVAQYDLVLSDLNLPDGSGLDLLAEYLKRRPDLPIVLVTAEGILENAIAAIRSGAYDYIVKTGGYLFALPVIVEKNLAIWRTKQKNERLEQELQASLEQVRVKNEQLRQLVAKLEAMAATDPLTGLANRRAFGDALGRGFAEAERNDTDLACVMADLDGFKQLNDTLGHPFGDRMLVLAANVLTDHCRQTDLAGRFGGDEFILLLPGADEAMAAGVAQRVQKLFGKLVAKEMKASGASVSLTISMGVATRRSTGAADPEALIAAADAALYRAKAAGKTRIELASNDAPRSAAG